MNGENDKENRQSIPTSATTGDIEDDARRYIAAEGGWNRVLKYIVHKNHRTNEYYPERSIINEAVTAGGFVTFFIASYYGSRNSYNAYIDVNRASAYQTKFAAERAAMDASVFGGLKQGVLLASKTCLFIGSFLGICQTLTVYRNKTSLLNYAFAGAFTGGLMRLHVGPRHLVAGSIIGCAMGLTVGVIIYPLTKLAGETQEEVHLRRICEMLQEQRQLQAVSTGSLHGAP